MKELQTISEKIYELEQKKAKKKKELDALDKEIKELKSETSSYMKKRQKNILVYLPRYFRILNRFYRNSYILMIERNMQKKLRSV